MNLIEQRTACPVTRVQTIISGKWKILILWHLKQGTQRFGSLQRLLPGISNGILTRQLRELEQDGMLLRKVYREIPIKVEYSLTDTGLSFLPILDAMATWSMSHMSESKQ
ncbi:winged helix-turn-helix transcriptional regulator [Exiguobacterium oxidotolerans]|uniref:Positive regulator of hxlAB expression (Formaldehyde sensing) n=1 Tax=Exiguobacterium oxidotolerans TaxID=223958 RepID=A0A653IGY2_9BACL|nr:helix-turn-helix domain-containing protein [Exiguobacterium oxidotolerans]VWX38402.1 positive regulator of hxlAB expression (formaldehyde sensing) [Exiguobacterium oxidotolerans]